GFVKYGALERDVVDDTVWEAVQEAPGAEPYTDEEFAATQRSAWRKATAKRPEVDDAASAFGGAPASGGGKGAQTAAQRAVEYAFAHFTPYRTTDGERFAVPTSGPPLALRLGSDGGQVRDRIMTGLYDATGKPWPRDA